MMTAPQPINALSEIITDYAAVLLDAWGVLHDGHTLFPDVANTLKELQRADKPIVILTNAARREADLCVEMSRVGLLPGSYQHLVSSGELAWQALRYRSDPEHAALGRRCYHLGPERNTSLLQGLDLDQQDRLEAAEFIIATGLARPHYGIAEHAPLLELAATLRLPMLCANPDRQVVRAGRVGIAAGALAESYQTSYGGRVIWHGKPGAAIYARALDKLAPLEPRRVLAIGDALVTDIAGARRQGLDSVLITSGIHDRELRRGDADGLARLCRQHGVEPDFVMPELAW